MKILPIFLVILPIYFEGSDATCGCEYEYKKVGCYEDRDVDRALPEMLANERDKHSIYYNGHDLNWFDWHNYMPQMVCRCAEQAMKKGYKYFGLQYWGECWSGSSQAQYNKYGEGGSCYGPEYKMCDSRDSNCVGDHLHNFVYEIATFTCDVHFEKIGCYKDYEQDNEHVLSARVPGASNYVGQPIDWWNYDVFLPMFACECAKKTVENGYNTFGLQYYGECWTGQKFEEKHYIAQGETTNCINQCYQSCTKWNRFCIGRNFVNTVYRITHPDCEVKYVSLGCYKAVDDNNNNMAMPELLINEISPASDKFYGYMLEFDESWETMYSQLLCRCARATEDKGYANFAIRNKGECWSGPSSGQSYSLYGQSDNCIRNETDPCVDNIKCAGDENSINVYKLLGNTIHVLGKK
ncbi:Hypothetical predicted protein [Paramuricea clavata]|uniref:Uncharacterized protein n=1 Tax=Paramuricea clavata TaxID=317549 RepID=A0A7D9HSH8_PARCT|nr:Hypothetical predicted protein [Paramuricea clavata]